MKIHVKCVLFATFLYHVTVSAISPRMIMGYHSGELKRCKFNNVDSCITIRKLDSPVNALAVAGEYVYVGLHSGEIRRCSQFHSSNCTLFHQLDTEINAMTFSGKNIFLGTSEGITKCGLRKSEDCELFYSSEMPIYSLTTFGSQLYAGSENNIFICSPDVSANCTILSNTTSAVNAISVYGQHMYLGLKEKSVEVCELNELHDCYTLFSTQSDIKDLDIFDRDVQASLESGEILRYNFDTENMTTVFSENALQIILSMSIVYDTKSVEKHYIGESGSCVWQFTSCPPFVVYYDVQSRAALELHVKNGKIYTAEGDLFDTDGSDWGHTGRNNAIFVMDSTGRIFASNSHPIGLLHHSSLMSGKPAAAAGEIKANDGVITKLTSCSGHYRPSIEFVNQVISALKKQGYNRTVSIMNCFGSELLIDLDYKKTDLYYKAKYEEYSRKIKEANN